MDLAQIHLTKDPWLSGLLQRDAYNLCCDEKMIEHIIEQFGESDKMDSGDFERLRRLQSQPVFITAKVHTTNVDACQFLEQHGFRLVDTNVSFGKKVGTRPQPSARYRMKMEFRWAEPADRDAVVDIARRSFQYSRFHLDPVIPNELANEIKASWAGNYFSGERGNEMVVATERGRIIGFAQLVGISERSFTIDLIAVDPNFQRQGAAAGMIHFAETLFIERWPDLHGPRAILVGTQLANQTSISMYQNLGFRLFSSKYVFHFHNPPDYVTK